MIHRYGEALQLKLETRSGPEGTFFLEQPAPEGICAMNVVEPFGYQPVQNPVLECQRNGGQILLEVNLVRSSQSGPPRTAGYWHQQVRALLRAKEKPGLSEEDVAAWLEAIRIRYPGLPGFESLGDLYPVLEPGSPKDTRRQLRRELATTLLNLASGRLAVFSPLSSGRRVGDWVEETYHQLISPPGVGS